MGIKKERIGEIGFNNKYDEMVIIEYNNADNIIIKFKETGELVKSSYRYFKNGEVKSHFTPTVYGVGVTGLEVVRDEKGELLNSFVCWKNMLQRCYSCKYQEKYPTYKNCKVSEEWLHYSSFKKWYDVNYYEIEGENMVAELDKDILFKNNKIYSSETCIFVPHNINKLFIKCDNVRGLYPVGVYFHRASEKYISMCRDGNGKKIHLGLFSTPLEAFNTYKEFKENLIKIIAEKHKHQIPFVLYEAMLSYTVNIYD